MKISLSQKLVSLHLTVIVLSCILFSCSKKGGTESESTLQKLQHKWTLVSETDNDTPSGAFKFYTGNPKDIITFNSDGNAIWNLYGDYNNPETLPYSLINDSQILVYWDLNKPDTFEIKTLTSSQLELYRGHTGSWEEKTIFKR